MDLRALLGSLQLPVAALGVVVLVFAIGGALNLEPPPPGSDGFVGGLAIIFLYFLAWVGFLVLSAGLAIPPQNGYGLRFTRYQRGLFLLATLAALLSAVGPFVAFGLVYSRPELFVTSWVVLTGLAICSLVGGLVWRGVQVWRSDVTLFAKEA